MGDVDNVCAARRIGIAGVALAVMAFGCSDGEDGLTELVVAVHTDMSVPGQLASVHLHVVGPSGETAVDQSVSLEASGAPSIPLTLSLTPGSGALLPVVITATGTGPAGGVERWVETGFVQGERRLVALWLLEACVGVPCPEGQTCGAGGACAEAAVPPESLPPWTGDPDADAGTDAATVTDAGMATDAATDGDADGGCILDTDCPDDGVECKETCVNALDPCATSGQTCEADVTTYTCDDGACVASTTPDVVPCQANTDGYECADALTCMNRCESGSCVGSSWCMDPCWCDAQGNCTNGSDAGPQCLQIE